MTDYQDTSRAAWDFIHLAGRSGDIDRAIIAALMSADGPLTGEGIWRETAITSKDSITGNLRHLKEAGLVRHTGTTRTLESGRQGHLVELVPPDEWESYRLVKTACPSCGSAVWRMAGEEAQLGLF